VTSFNLAHPVYSSAVGLGPQTLLVILLYLYCVLAGRVVVSCSPDDDDDDDDDDDNDDDTRLTIERSKAGGKASLVYRTTKKKEK